MTTSLATPTLYMTPASDTGVSHTDGVTDDAVPVFAGTASPGALVTLTDATSGLSVTVQADRYGDFVAMFAGLEAGAHTLTASSKDAAGNVSRASNPYNIDIETQASATSTAPGVSAAADTVYFTVHFNQPVSDVTALSFKLVTTGDAYGIVDSVQGSGEDYTVEVRGLGGEGTVGLAFSDDAPTDLAGNQIALTSGLHPVSNTTGGVAAILVSATASGVQGTGATPTPSGGGGVVAFISDDGGLVPGVQTTAGVRNVYVKSLFSGAIVQVTNGNDQSGRVAISADGSTIAFSSFATNLVPGGTSDGLNLYVAKLTSPSSSGGLSLVPGSIQLVGELNDLVADGSDVPGFSLSGDGSTIAYEGNSTAPDGTTDVETDYLKNLKTGAQFQFATDGDLSSISLDGTKVAYTALVNVPGTGGEPDPYEGGTFPPNVIQDAFVYNAVTNTSITIDGSGLLPGTNPPLGPGETPDYLTETPKLSGDGNTVVFQLSRGTDQSSLFSVNLANPSVFSPVSPGASSDGGTDNDFGQTVSVYGGVIAYTSIDSTGAYHAEIYIPSTQTTTELGGAFQTSLTKTGNAVVYVEPADASDTEGITYENTLGVSASIAPIDGTDAIDAAELKQAKTNGLAVSGTTNAPAGSAVLLLVTDATKAVRLHTFDGAVGDGGTWTATIPADIAATLTDGDYALVVQVVGTSGASVDARAFTVDTVSPAQPVIPHLDPGSAAGLGQNGTPVTNTATPTIDGVTEPLSLVSLYADVAGILPVAVASARADQNGLYSITAPRLGDGIQDLEVQAVDPAGNPSPFSSSLEIIIDTTPPDPPPTPTLLYYSDSPDGPVTDVPRLSVIGTAEPNSDVTLVDAITGDVLATDVVVGADGTYAATTHELADGKYAVAAYATDQAGNVGKPSENGADVTIDTQAPDAPTIASVSGGTASDGSLSPSLDISGEAEPFSQVALLVDGAPDTFDRAVTADEDGAFDLQTEDLPAGAHTLTVTATDFAGNVSNASAPMTVTISDTAVVPPGTATLHGIVTDGPISAATVFADANGNGTLDPGEAGARTGADGSFTLYGPSGELVATGGIDSTTGLANTLTLTAPAGSTVISPLTTLLDAYAALTEADPRSVQPQFLAALGLPVTIDLTTLDPNAALLAGDGLPEVLGAKVMDTLTDIQAYLAGNGITESGGFAAGFTAIAEAIASVVALPNNQVLDLNSGSTLQTIFKDAAGSASDLSNPIGSNASVVTTVAAAGNASLTADLQAGGSGLAAAVAGTELAYQGAAATALRGVGTSTAIAAEVAGLYTTGLRSSDLGLISGPPRLARDPGQSDTDHVIDTETPTFVGTALPGTEVALFESYNDVSYNPGYANVTVIGVGTADALGNYSITPVALDTYSDQTPSDSTEIYLVGAYGSAPTQGNTFSVGQTLEVPGDTPSIQVEVDPGVVVHPTITDATVAAAQGDDSGHAAVYVWGTLPYFGQVADDEGGTISIYADGNPIPVATSSIAIVYNTPTQSANSSFFGLTTAPLSDGTHVLTVTDTLAGGTVVQGTGSDKVTVATPPITDGAASASGSIEGARVYNTTGTLKQIAVVNAGIYQTAYNDVPTLIQSGELVDTVESTTGEDGSYQIAAGADNFLAATGGWDTLTGLPLGGALAQMNFPYVDALLHNNAGSLLAPAGSTAISPLTSVEALLSGGTTAAAKATLAAFQLPSNLNLATLDPLAAAEDGDVRPFLVDAELLDTVTMLSPFTGFSFAAIAYYVGKKGTLNLASVADVTALLTTYFPNISHLSSSSIPALAAIIADSNEAIENEAAAAVSLADTLSYTLAAETVAQESTTAALEAAVIGPNAFTTVQTADITAATAAFTGANLTSAIAAARAGSAQATGFVVAGPLSTAAANVDFTISFGTSVSGLTTAYFANVTDGDLTGTRVTNLAPIAGSNGSAYDVSVATGAGSGSLALSFQPGTSLLTGSFSAVSNALLEPTETVADSGGEAVDVVVGDLNGDGRPDAVLLTQDYGGSFHLTVLVNQGGGTFAAGPPLLADPGNFGTLAIGDFNGDGKPDLITISDTVLPLAGVGAPSAQLQVVVLPGQGDGTFGTAITSNTTIEASDLNGAGSTDGQAMIVGDFNHDGRLDLAIAGSGSIAGYYGYVPGDTVYILLGNGDGTFRAGPNLDTATDGFENDRVTALATADFNNDGNVDIVALNTNEHVVDVYLGNGDGTFRNAPSLQNTGSAFACGDVNGDGDQDIVVLDDNTLEVFLGNGDGTFTTLAPIVVPPILDGLQDLPISIALADLNGDGRLDVVMNGQYGTQVLEGKGDGTFALAYSSSDAASGGVLAVADVNGDGRPDVLVPATVDAESVQDGPQIGLNVLLNTPQTVVGSTSQAVTIDRPVLADPVLSKSSGAGTLTVVGNAYTLNLGTLSQGAAASVAFALDNIAAAPADSFDGLFSTPSGDGFTVAGAVLPQPVAAGGSSGGLTFTANTGAPGTYSETITFAPRDTTAIPAVAATPDPDGGDAPSQAAAPVANPVAAELPAITLTVTDDVVAGGVGAAILAPVPAIALPNVRVGDTDGEAITISNSAAAPSADLDVTATASGDATVNGSVSGLAPQASDSTSLVAGLGTATAGLQSGTITLAPVSEPSTALADQDVAVSGSVYRPATATVTPIAAILHVGDAGVLPLGIANADPADGFSEDLDAKLTTVSGPFSATAGASTGVVSAGALSNALTVSFSTMVASVLTGSATVGLSSDGGAAGTGLDGLGTLALPSQTAPLSVTVDNYASASLQLLAGTGVLAASGTNYTLDLGIMAQGAAPLTEVLGVVNAASGPADLLSGQFALSDANAIGLTGFSDFAGLASGQTDGGLDISLDTSDAGSFTRTVTLTPTGSNASGYSGALTPETLTITGTVAAAAASGGSPGGTTVSTGSQPGTSTPSSTTPVYRFFDTIHGTHFYTQSLSEAQNILSSRPDLMEETNNFGAVNPQTDPNAQAVYRFFEASNGTHFFTTSYQEYLGLTTAAASTYRPDLTYEANSTFYEHTTAQSGDVAVYRFFDTVQGTQYLTGSQTEYAGLTTMGSSTYRPDLTPEGVAFYAPAGSFST